MSATIELTGWTLVHCWNEPHGNGHDDVYQGEGRGLNDKVKLMTVCTRRGQATSIRTELSSHDYLLAKAIRSDLARYAPLAERTISPCCTSGYDDFEDMRTGNHLRVVSVAGHGEYAFPVD